MSMTLRDLRAQLARATGRRKLDLILDAPDPTALVRSLPAEDLYFAITEIGPDDAAPLVQLASPSQLRTFVDLDAWRSSELLPERVAAWLHLSRGDDDEAYREKLAGLDVEVLELLLRASVRIVDLEEEEDPGDVAGTVERSPDGRYLLVYPEESVEYAEARRLVLDLYDRDAFEAVRMLSAVRWELESELTETALRWRDARLADLGFPSREEAASLYARVPPAPAPAAPAAPPEEPPGFFLAAFEREGLLDRALAELAEEARDRVQRELVAVMNMAMVADGVEPSDLAAVRQEARAVRDTISIGLGALAAGDPARAAAALEGTALKRVFQVGFTRTLELRWRLDRLLARLPLRLPGGAILADPPDDAIAAGLLARRPRLADRGELRPLADEQDVAAASESLDRVEQLGQALAAAGLDVDRAAGGIVRALGEAGLAVVRGGDLVATALAREAAGLERGFDPLPASSLDAALRGLLDGGRVRGEIRSRAAVWPGEPIAARVLRRIEDELAPQLAAGGVDRRAALPLIVEV